MGLEHESWDGSALAENVIIKCALLGDGLTGKTCMLNSYARDIFQQEYTATMSDEYIVPLLMGDNQVLLNVLDTAGQNDFEAFREHIYMDSDVLVLCFSICDVESFSNILHFWLPEMKQHTKRKIPVLLVGTQSDMRSNVTKSEVAPEEGRQMAKLIGADVYVECSAKTGSGLDNVFSTAIESVLRRRKRRNSLLRRLFQRSAKPVL